MSEPATESSASWQKPSWGKLGFAALATGLSFLLPQETPLEWYPLNEPGTDINYLELTCASDKAGDVQIFYNLNTGINQLHSIYFPISPTTQTFTYTFPLPDAPITELRIDPVAQGGALTIRQMRIINRRGEENRRFTRDLFLPQHEIAEIAPLADGWKLVSSAGASDPHARIELRSPIVPVGKDHRNLLRCLLSTGYLAGMLLILLLAVLFATWRPRGWRDFFIHAAFLATLALLFSFVGNRGLIRNSIHYARFTPPTLPPGLNLEFDLTTDNPALQAQLFWDDGQGLNETSSHRVQPENHAGLQTLRFPLPTHSLQTLRFDPLNGAVQLSIRGIRLTDSGGNTRLTLPLDSLLAVREISDLRVEKEHLLLKTTPDASDPITEFTPAAMERINRTLTGASRL